MGVIHCKQHDFAIYTPPRCGSKIVDKIVDFPEFEGLFTVDQELDRKPRKNMIVIIRNHAHRVLSTYYDKIVETNPNEYSGGWKWENAKDPTGIGYTEGTYDTFKVFIENLGMNSFDTHLAPYLCQPTIRTAVERTLTCDEPCVTLTLLTYQIQDQLIPAINYFIGRPRSKSHEGHKRFLDMVLPHKISYSPSLPPPSNYGASRWCEVHRLELERCHRENGSLPTPKLMYDEYCERTLGIQLGYKWDNIEFNKCLKKEVNLLAPLY